MRITTTFLGCCSALFVCGVLSRSAVATEHLVIKAGDHQRHVTGRILIEARDGGLLAQGRDGAEWFVQPTELVRRDSDNTPFVPLTADEVADQLLQEMPAGFRIHQTAHYVICYNTSEVYAEWCGGLYERLYRGFHGYWKNRGMTLVPCEFPLIALVFDNQVSYARYSRKELGQAATAMIGYYNMQTNRVTMYDLTGVDSLRRQRSGARSTAHINQILSQPAAERTVATIVHEATHQLAYNSGLQTRFAANPFWVSEGIAVFFETPDLRSSKGWRNIGAVNRIHLDGFRKSLASRPADALMTLLQDDSQFRDPRKAPVVYANAWALTYYLLRARRQQYIAYLQDLAKLAPLSEEDATQRVTRFKRFFGDDLDKLEQDFLRYMRRVR